MKPLYYPPDVRHLEALQPILNRGLVAMEDAKVFRMLNQAAGLPVVSLDIEVETAKDFVEWVQEHPRLCPEGPRYATAANPCIEVTSGLNWQDADDVLGRRCGLLCTSCGARYLIKLVRLKFGSKLGRELMEGRRNDLLARVMRGIILDRFERILRD